MYGGDAPVHRFNTSSFMFGVMHDSAGRIEISTEKNIINKMTDWLYLRGSY